MEGIGRIDLLNVVHGVDGLLGIVVIGITDEAEASAATSVTVLNDHLDAGENPRLTYQC